MTPVWIFSPLGIPCFAARRIEPVHSMNTLEGQTCPFCGAGKFVLTSIDYEAELPYAQTVLVPDLLVERCDRCRETVFPVESSQRIDSAIAEHTRQSAPHGP